MTGSHEVRGSIPLSSTKDFKGLCQLRRSPFCILELLVQGWYKDLGLRRAAFAAAGAG